MSEHRSVAATGAGSDLVRRELARDDLRRVQSVLVTAEVADHPAERYLAAHRAALGVAAVVLSLRAGRVRAARQDAWRLVARVAPEYAEWAGFFAATRSVRDAAHRYCTAPVRHGAGPVSAREADDMVREAGRFADLVRSRVEVRLR